MMQGLGFMGGGGGSSRASSVGTSSSNVAFNPVVNVSNGGNPSLTPQITGSATATPTVTSNANGGDSGGGASGADPFGFGGGSVPWLPNGQVSSGRLSPTQPVGTVVPGVVDGSNDLMLPLLLGGGALLFLMNE